jgi:hypothetical protein
MSYYSVDMFWTNNPGALDSKEDFLKNLMEAAPKPLEDIGANRTFTEMFRSKAANELRNDKLAVRVNLGRNFSCRESVLFSVNEAMQFNFGGKAPSYNYTTVAFELTSEKEWGKTMLEFSDKFLYNNYGNSGFRIQEWRNQYYLLANLWDLNNYMYHLFIASALMWIFRRSEILKATMKYEGVHSLNPLFSKLAWDYLENSHWGDGANPPVMLSLFSYGVSIGDTFGGSIYANGPSNAAALRTSYATAISYVKNVFTKKFTAVSDIIGRVGTSNNGVKAILNEYAVALLKNAELETLLRDTKASYEEKIKELSAPKEKKPRKVVKKVSVETE